MIRLVVHYGRFVLCSRPVSPMKVVGLVRNAGVPFKTQYKMNKYSKPKSYKVEQAYALPTHAHDIGVYVFPCTMFLGTARVARPQSKKGPRQMWGFDPLSEGARVAYNEMSMHFVDGDAAVTKSCNVIVPVAFMHGQR